MTIPSRQAIAIEIGKTRCAAARPAAPTRTTSADSVAYATDESGSEAKIGRASHFGSSVSWSWPDRIGRPTRTRRNRFGSSASSLNSGKLTLGNVLGPPARAGRYGDVGAGEGLRTIVSLGACARIQVTSFAVKPPLPPVRCGRDDPVEVLLVPEPLQRVRRAPPLLDPRVDRHARPESRVLDGLEQRQRHRDLVAQRRVLRIAERDEQEVGGDEGRVLGASEPDRRIEDGLVERAAGERDEDPVVARARTAQPEAAACHEDSAQDGRESCESDDRGDHSVSRSRSARFATTRMSRPGSSRTMRERSEPPKISRRRDSSGVPTKM